jgi:hypothetical protein
MTNLANSIRDSVQLSCLISTSAIAATVLVGMPSFIDPRFERLLYCLYLSGLSYAGGTFFALVNGIGGANWMYGISYGLVLFATLVLMIAILVFATILRREINWESSSYQTTAKINRPLDT